MSPIAVCDSQVGKTKSKKETRWMRKSQNKDEGGKGLSKRETEKRNKERRERERTEHLHRFLAV
jgi:hypothetical protein